jgi:hypothetical protein
MARYWIEFTGYSKDDYRIGIYPTKQLARKWARLLGGRYMGRWKEIR